MQTCRAHCVTVTRFTARPNGEQLNCIAGHIDAGKVRPHIAAVLPLAEVQEAHRRIEHDHLRGKLVLRVAVDR